jgi:hypothetical protein
MEKILFQYSNCTIKVHKSKDNLANLRKATENFLREVIKEKKCINRDK